MNTETKTVKYFVQIKETLKRVVTVELPEDSNEDPVEKVMDDYFSEKIILSGDDFADSEFELLESAIETTQTK